MQKKKIYAYLSVLLAFLMLIGCTPDHTTPPDEKQEKCPDGELPIVWDGKTDYQVVRSDYATGTFTKNIASIRTAIQNATGCEPDIVTDWEEDDIKTTEIIVGKTKREASVSVLAGLGENEFAICVVDQSLVIVGKNDSLTETAITYFTEHILPSATTGKFTVSKELNLKMNIKELQLKENVVGSPLKKQYSDYNSHFVTSSLISFDDADIPGEKFSTDCEFAVDTQYQKEGNGALRITLKKDFSNELCTVMWQKEPGARSFDCPVYDRHTATLKLWLYIDDIDTITCDHDTIYGQQIGQATFFFRVMDNKGGVYCWNHTVTQSGWHEIELSFNVHNGVSDNFDYENIVSFGLLFSGKEGAMIELDDLRLVDYVTNYQPEDVPSGCRLITDSEYDAFDGAIIQEWYGASYDSEDKMQGKSSLRCIGDATVSDFRLIIANLDIPLTYAEDVLVVWMKVKDLSTITGVFIEMNEVQDVHEYEQNFSVEMLKKYGLQGNDTWSCVKIPLNAFKQNLNQKYGTGESLTMHNFRFVVCAEKNKTYEAHMDRVYVTTLDQMQ